MKSVRAVALLLVLSVTAWMATGMGYYEHYCWDPPEVDSISVGFKNPLGQTRSITFAGEEALFIQTWRGKSAFDWKNIKGIRLSSRGRSDQILISVEMAKPGDETSMLEGGYISDSCLRKVVARFGSRLKFIETQH